MHFDARYCTANRRGRDSNPRYRYKPVRRFSKPLVSATHPPLHTALDRPLRPILRPEPIAKKISALIGPKHVRTVGHLALRNGTDMGRRNQASAEGFSYTAENVGLEASLSRPSGLLPEAWQRGLIRFGPDRTAWVDPGGRFPLARGRSDPGRFRVGLTGRRRVGGMAVRGPVAQRLEQATHNRLVVGSNPPRPSAVLGG